MPQTLPADVGLVNRTAVLNAEKMLLLRDHTVGGV
jgi:hypothetical protein